MSTYPTNTCVYQLATQLLWDPNGFPPGYTSERVAFDVVYNWVLNNIEWKFEVDLTQVSAVPDGNPDRVTGDAANGTSVEQSMQVELGHSETLSAELTITRGMSVGTTVGVEISAEVLGTGITGKVDLSMESSLAVGTTESNSETTNVDVIATVNVPPHTQITATATMQPLLETNRLVLKGRPHMKPGTKPFLIQMNYGSWSGDLNYGRHQGPDGLVPYTRSDLHLLWTWEGTVNIRTYQVTVSWGHEQPYKGDVVTMVRPIDAPASQAVALLGHSARNCLAPAAIAG